MSFEPPYELIVTKKADANATALGFGYAVPSRVSSCGPITS